MTTRLAASTTHTLKRYCWQGLIHLWQFLSVNGLKFYKPTKLDAKHRGIESSTWKFNIWQDGNVKKEVLDAKRKHNC